ncbi:uncharacterized protein LOC126817315 isoform X2 [Patella vulgata]|uniref:uncharacterized protein LOC126817315 isoform X2 n=1 Tax=Patella vulgata TaxID=6465 RepID=UPI0024A87CC6|nr:uncharacterized protein LOC126817315 isoform X2 [Patella vulgata]
MYSITHLDKEFAAVFCIDIHLYRNLRICEMWAVLLTTACIIVKVSGDIDLDLKKLQQDFYQWRLKDSPEFSSEIGQVEYNDLVTDFSVQQFDRRKKIVEDYIMKLNKIDRIRLSKDQQYSYDVFLDTMQTFVDNYKWRYYGALNPITAIEGFQTDPAFFLKVTPFDTKGDFENYIARLIAYPKQIDQIIERFNMAIKVEATYHNVTISHVPSQLAKLIVSDPTQSVYFTPFNDTIKKLTVPQAEIYDMVKRGKEATANFIKSIKVLKSFIETTYMSNTRKSYGVDGWKDGQEYYKACLKWHLSTDMSPAEVHQKGLDEVKRIKEEITKLMREKEDFKGTLSQFYQIIKARPSLHMSNGGELLQEYNNIIFKRIYPALPKMFKNLPDLKVVVEEEPYDGPGGQYIIGTEDGSRPGVFQVNLLKPAESPTFNMMALSLHETVPGHHLQGGYALKAGLPGFQKNIEYERYFAIPYHFPFYTAYTEGWGLYAESLGEDLGLYKNYMELIGRYGFEIFRGCRLVVDTGLHYFKWSREQAVQYMIDNTPLPRAEIETEVNRYITWPGQACAYKIGEMKIRELRERARTALGSKFDIKDFHSVILTHGPVPLNLLETIVNDWIKETVNYHSAGIVG